MIDAEVDRRLQAEADLREEREKQERQIILLEKEQVGPLRPFGVWSYFFNKNICLKIVSFLSSINYYIWLFNTF